MLELTKGGLRVPERWGSFSAPSWALGKNEASNSDRRWQSDVERKPPRNQVLGRDADARLDHPLICTARGWTRRAGVPLAPACVCCYRHALSSLLSCLLPPPPPPHPPPGHPPKIEKERKLFPQAAAAQPEKLPSSEGAAGFLELETKSRPGSKARVAPTTPRPRLPSARVTSLIQQNTCPEVATLQAAEELWGAPGLGPGCPRAQGGRAGAWGQGGRMLPLPFLSFPPRCWPLPRHMPHTRHLAYEERYLAYKEQN